MRRPFYLLLAVLILGAAPARAEDPPVELPGEGGEGELDEMRDDLFRGGAEGPASVPDPVAEDVAEDILRPEGEPADDGYTELFPPAPAPAVQLPATPDAVGPTRIRDIAKVHNRPYGTKGRLALELVVDAVVAGHAGRHVGVSVTFQRMDTEWPILSTDQRFATPCGELLVKVDPQILASTGATRFVSRLTIPYATFPTSTRGTGYGVLAIVRLHVWDPGGPVSVVSQKVTTFRVYGPLDRGTVAPTAVIRGNRLPASPQVPTAPWVPPVTRR